MAGNGSFKVLKLIGAVVIIDAAVSLWVVNDHWQLNGLGQERTKLFFMDLGRFVRLIIGIGLMWY